MRTTWLAIWSLGLASVACGGSEFSDAATGGAGAAGATTGGAGKSGGAAAGGASAGAGGDAGNGGASAGTGGAAGTSGGGGAGASGGSGASGKGGAGASGKGGAGAGGASGAGAGGASGAGAGGAAGMSGGAGAGGGDPCAQQLTDDTGVYVSAAANDSGDGSQAAPVSTLAAAVALLSPTRRALYLASDGVYAERLVLPSGVDGLLVHGGYAPASGGGWVRTCGARASVASPDDVGAMVGGAAAASLSLRELRVSSATPSSPGSKTPSSSVALKITGPLEVSLEGVELTAGDGEEGRNGEPGGTPLLSACTALCKDGKAGESAGPGQPGALGTFSVDGFTPKAGGVGLAGKAGADGTAGSPAKVVEGCTTGCSGCPANGGCSANKSAKITVAPSVCGCGGPGGKPGEAGVGGGASVALFVAGGARVTASASTFTAGRGGDGGEGGDGGHGADGAPGLPGAVTSYQPLGSDGSAVCHRGDCYMTGSGANCGCYYQDTKPDNPDDPEKVFPNPPGGKGGNGGKGAKGGGGAGGPSIVIARDAASKVSTTGVTLTPGNPGLGKGSAPNGEAKDTLVF